MMHQDVCDGEVRDVRRVCRRVREAVGVRSSRATPYLPAEMRVYCASTACQRPFRLM
jgi:hypothetical protein